MVIIHVLWTVLCLIGSHTTVLFLLNEFCKIFLQPVLHNPYWSIQWPSVLPSDHPPIPRATLVKYQWKRSNRGYSEGKTMKTIIKGPLFFCICSEMHNAGAYRCMWCYKFTCTAATNVHKVYPTRLMQIHQHCAIRKTESPTISEADKNLSGSSGFMHFHWNDLCLSWIQILSVLFFT